MSQAKSRAVEEIFYPTTDGEPMGETDFHIHALIVLRESLQDWLSERKDVHIGADMFWYWEQGNPRVRRAPDLMVTFGVERRMRETFKSWEENDAVPAVIIELTSASTWKEDRYEKYEQYAELGVEEYFLFDPRRENIDPPLQGFRLHQGSYHPILTVEDLQESAEECLLCEQLGVWLAVVNNDLRLVDPNTRFVVPTARERVEAQHEQLESSQRDLLQAQLLAEQERQQRLALEEENAVLRAQLQQHDESEEED